MVFAIKLQVRNGGWGLAWTGRGQGAREYGPARERYQQSLAIAREVDDRIQVECLFAPPDPHTEDMFCQWRFTMKDVH